MIKKLRQLLGLSQSALANEIGLTQGQISHYETGRHHPDIEVAKRLISLCEARGIDGVDYNFIYGYKKNAKNRGDGSQHHNVLVID